MFNIKDTTQRLIFDPIRKTLNPIVVPPMEPTGYKSKGNYPEKMVSSIRDSIRYMESRGEKNPYSFYQHSGIDELGDALGAYQITEAKLNELSQKFLGRKVNRDEFLKDPSLQDRYVESQIKYLLDNNFKVNSLFTAHRGGWSDMSRQATIKRNSKYKQYMDEATKKYKELILE